MEKVGESEIICPKCGGEGTTPGVNYSYRICTKCLGSGKLDWIELCMGKNKRYVSDELPTERSVRTYISEHAKSAK